MDQIKALKKACFDSATDAAVPITNSEGMIVGNLVPIGSWALDDPDLIQSFFRWRKMFMRFFRAQFQASQESTKNYLRNFSILQDDRLLFAIYVDNDLFGHIGLSNVSEECAELDNVIRGVSGGPDDLLYYAERALLNWAFNTVGVRTVSAQVLSNNFLAMNLHERFGFEVTESLPLVQRRHEKCITYVPCDSADSTETFSLHVIELTNSSFNKIINA